jgi:hypothetical protein
MRTCYASTGPCKVRASAPSTHARRGGGAVVPISGQWDAYDAQHAALAARVHESTRTGVPYFFAKWDPTVALLRSPHWDEVDGWEYRGGDITRFRMSVEAAWRVLGRLHTMTPESDMQEVTFVCARRAGGGGHSMPPLQVHERVAQYDPRGQVLWSLLTSLGHPSPSVICNVVEVRPRPQPTRRCPSTAVSAGGGRRRSRRRSRRGGRERHWIRRSLAAIVRHEHGASVHALRRGQARWSRHRE